jgi:putative phosphoesterase
MRSRTTLGVISDTHGLLRPEAIAALAGSDRIVHCGDIGAPEVIAGLRGIAPVVAIRGNVDRGAWARRFPTARVVETAGVRLYVLHDLAELDFDPAAAGFQVVLSGHSHRPRVERRSGVLFVNPGSAGPRRFRLPVAVARLEVASGRVDATIVPLAPAGAVAGRPPVVAW